MTTLFEYAEAKREQDHHLSRVSSRIAGHIISFFIDRGRGAEFHNAELVAYIRAAGFEVAPDSPGRIMRDLRSAGTIDYVVVNRRQSLYRITSSKRSAA